jgi:hypothetical protein
MKQQTLGARLTLCVAIAWAGGYKLVTEDLAGACVVWLVDAVGFTYTGWLTCTVVLATFFGY